MAVNSKQKGNRGEREWASFCREQGYNVRRTQQYAGVTEESADCIGLPYIHQEVKRVEKLNIYDAIGQANNDANTRRTLEMDVLLPIVAHRKNGKPWLVTMDADDWFVLYSEFYSGKVIEGRKQE